MAHRYNDNAGVKAHLDKQNIKHDAQIGMVAEASAHFIDQQAGRTFRKLTQTRKLCVDSSGVVPVVDLVSVTSVKVDTDRDRTFGQTIDSASYELLPWTDQEAGGIPSVRWQWVRPLYTGANASYFVPGYAVEIVGDWGYYEGDPGSEVEPQGISYADLLFIARWFKRRESPLQVTTMPSFGFRRMFEEEKDGMDILQDYIHPSKDKRVSLIR